MSRHGSNYPRELRERAVRMVAEVEGDYPSEWAAIGVVASTLGIGSTETLRKWVRQSEVDAGERPGLSSEERAQIKALTKENAELRRQTRSSRRPRLSPRRRSTAHRDPGEVHRGQQDPIRVAPICRVLSEHGIKIAPSSYYDAKSRPPSMTS